MSGDRGILYGQIPHPMVGGVIKNNSNMTIICNSCLSFDYKPNTVKYLDRYKCKKCGGDHQALRYVETAQVFNDGRLTSMSIMKGEDGVKYVIDTKAGRCFQVNYGPIKISAWQPIK